MDLESTLYTWDKCLLPLVVLYSPNLRLRYRAAWERCAERINETAGLNVFVPATEAECHLAFDLETRNGTPPRGVVYVVDCRDKFDVDGKTAFYCNSKNIIAAKVMLPKSEETPLDTIKATLHQICHCLGLPDSTDPTSIMWPRVKERPEVLNQDDVTFLVNLF